MPAPFVVRFAIGVTPGKWAGVWKERMPRHHLDLQPAAHGDALAALADGSVDMAFLRDPLDRDAVHAIPLYAERQVVVAPKGHALEAAETVTLAELEEFESVPGADIPDTGWADAVQLVAANVGVAVMPKSVARVLSRKDVVSREIADAEETGVFLVWPRVKDSDDIQTFIGIVRGRTRNSSRAGAESGGHFLPPPRRQRLRPSRPQGRRRTD